MRIVALIVAIGACVLSPPALTQDGCGMPSADQWAVAAPQSVGLTSAALCPLVKWLNDSKENVHAVLVARHGTVFEHYFSGRDEAWGRPLGNVAFGAVVRHDERSVTKSIVALLLGLAVLAAMLPIGRLSFGAWVGVAALSLCLLTGYVYGNLFFTPIDVPFLATMCWATLAIMWMARRAIPTWTATACAGLAMGLAIGTRTGGIITHAYLMGVMALCATEAIASGMPARQVLTRIALRTAADGWRRSGPISSSMAISGRWGSNSMALSTS